MPTKSVEDLEAGARIRGHLRQQMAERGISKAELSRRIQADDGQVTRLLNGSRVPGVGQVLRICRGLKISASRLLEEDPAPRYQEAPTGNKSHT